jgi:hypothetical protein
MDNLPHATFTENLNSDFSILLDETTTVQLVLVEVSDLRERDRYQAFSILFRGPRESMVPQGLYKIEHGRMGSFDIFLVPVGVGEEGYQYEAVFNRKKEKTS